MSEKTPTAYIFGAGSGGTKSFHFYRRRFRILGFLDNDVTRHGRMLHGLPIVSPTTVRELGCDRVIVGSQYFREICDQLIVEGLAPEKIIVADPEVLGGLYRFSPGLVAGLVGGFLVAMLAFYGLLQLIAS